MNVVADVDLVQSAVWRELDAGHVVGLEPGAEALGLVAEVLHHLRAHDPFGEARVVLDIGRLLEQAAPREALDHERLEVGARGVQRGRVPGRATADDDHVFNPLVDHFIKYS